MQNILAIETSCDETSAAVVQTDGMVLANVIASQIDVHKDYGGVIPEIASRMHVEAINIVIEEALAKAGVTMQDIAALAVTKGPGLLGSLLIGLQAAKTLAFIHKLPLIAVNHIEGHIFANFLASPTASRSPLSKFGEGMGVRRFLCLIVSGGHTQLVISENEKYHTIGRTIDDAVGESYDKVARLLQLGYPGGPLVDNLAKKGDASKVRLLRKKLNEDGYDFSFSGLKTAVLNYHRNQPEANPADICAAFQKIVVDSLVGRTFTAAKEYNIDKIYLAGGVAANSALRETMLARSKDENIYVGIPPLNLCTDNAAMIGGAAIPKFLQKNFSGLDIKAEPGLKL